MVGSTIDEFELYSLGPNMSGKNIAYRMRRRALAQSDHAFGRSKIGGKFCEEVRVFFTHACAKYPNAAPVELFHHLHAHARSKMRGDLNNLRCAILDIFAQPFVFRDGRWALVVSG
jgi:hypothetical protein